MEALVKFRKTIMLAVKFLCIASITSAFVSIWQNYYNSPSVDMVVGYVIVLSYLVILITFMHLYGGFRIGINRLHEIIYSQSLAVVFTNFIMYLELSLVIGDLVIIPPVIMGIAFQIVLVVVGSYCSNMVYFKLYRARKMLAVFDNAESGRALIRKMSKIPERFQISRGISLSHYGVDEIKRLINDFEAIIISDIDSGIKYDLLRYCYERKKRIYVLPSSTDIIVSSSYHIQISDTPVLMCKNRGLTVEQAVIKRMFDMVMSLIGIIIAAPFMIIISIAIKVCDRGPVLFKQNRVTKDGKIFNVLKFRSMVVDADKDGAVKATDNDARITPVGRIIRPLRLDELPQLFNILKGSMSFVGPRPERIENVYEYTRRFPDFDLRHRVKGGLTGYAQIYGKYNTTPEDKLKMDLIYIERYSLLLDLKLLAMTIKILFMKESTEGFTDKDNKGVQKSKSIIQTEEDL